MKNPWPKKVAQAVKNLALEACRKQPPAELTRHLNKLLQNVGPDAVRDLSSVYSALRNRVQGSSGETLFGALERFTEIEHSILRNNPTVEATIPVVLERHKGRAEAIGSAVLIRIAKRTFLLTAAHVTDRWNDGLLLIPGREGFMPISGNFSSMRLPASGRTDDKYDIAYVWLDEGCVSKIHPDCSVLERPDVSLEAEPSKRMLYTVAGYPWRKSRTKANAIETESQTFTGVEEKGSEYELLGIHRSTHIAIRFHRRQVFHLRLRRVMAAPLPHGMSGGGVYAWNEEAMKDWPVRLPLVGIVNEFRPERSLLIATRLQAYVRCIFHNQPDLAAIAG